MDEGPRAASLTTRSSVSASSRQSDLRAGDRRDLRRCGSRGRLLSGRDGSSEARRWSPSSGSSRSNKDEIAALQILYSRALRARELTFSQIKELAQAISRPPHRWTPEVLWAAYEALDERRCEAPSTVLHQPRLPGALRRPPQDELVPFPDQVLERFEVWLLQQRGWSHVHARAARVAGEDQGPRGVNLARDHDGRLLRTRRSSSRAGSGGRRRCSATTCGRCSTSSTRPLSYERPSARVGAVDTR